jgi:hypothetical protein
LANQPAGGNNPAAVQDSFMRGIKAMGEIIQQMRPENEKDQFTWEALGRIIQGVQESLSLGKWIIENVNTQGSDVPLEPIAQPVHTDAAA